MLFKFKYPKLVVLVLSIILAYIIFTNPAIKEVILGAEKFSYLRVFIAGMLISFGFTAPLSVGFFITLNPENIVLSGAVGALGAMISNLLIFNLVKFSFKKEFFSLKKDINKVKIFRRVEEEFKKDFSRKIRHYLMYVFIGIFIASPLPDEIGEILLAGFTKVKLSILILFSFVLHFIEIMILLWI
ncbi:MAG: hypothetical protein PHH54_03925 [Candidatus Nanoarchaeia archaeon]|nr:hypothetical protein [Candidatus Nanoarchaeia archaeon]MDD5741108.1 hypothetical protein [Candidatus Nanoarchaeia archaeon]